MDGVIHVRPLGRGFVLHNSSEEAIFASRKNLYDWWRNGREFWVHKKTKCVYTDLLKTPSVERNFCLVVNARELLELSRRKDLPARTRTKAAEG